MSRFWLGEAHGASHPSGRALAAMRLGQHVLAVALTVLAVVRAVADGTDAAAAIAAGVAFLLWYGVGVVVVADTRNALQARLWLIGLALVWFAAVAVSAEFVWLAFLLWLLAGHLVPGWWSVLFAVPVYVVTVLAPVVHHGSTGYANVIGPLVGGVFALGISRGYLQLLQDAAERERLLSSLARAQQEMTDLQDELALTQRHAGAIAERTRVSRDIHDTVAQHLSSIRLLSHAASDTTSDPAVARTLEQIETLAADGLTDARRVVAALAPAELDDALAAALTRMLERLRDETGVQVELHVDDTLPPLSTATEVALMRTAQSALANIRLHAHASRVVVSLIDDHDGVRLDIIDDGRGFDVNAWNHQAPRADESGYGLRFMRSRLREVGGSLDIESAPGDGTALSGRVPLTSLGKG